MKLKAFLSAALLLLATALPAQRSVLYVFSNTNPVPAAGQDPTPVSGYGVSASPDFLADGTQFVNGDVTITTNDLVRWQLSKNGGSSLRVYTGGTITFSVPDGYLISKIRMKRSFLQNELQPEAGTYVSVDDNGLGDKYKDCTGLLQSVKFTNVRNNVSYSGMDSIWVYYSAARTVNVTAAGYATLYQDIALTVPEGMQAAAVFGMGDGVQVDYLYQEGETIPAETGVLLKAAEGTYTFIESANEGTAPTSNDLYGTLTDQWISKSGYYLYKLALKNTADTNSVGFYWGNSSNGGTFQNAARHAYLALPKSAGIRAFVLGDDTATGIGNVTSNATDANAKVYDLQGRRVVTPQQGVYIYNGQKRIQ